MLIHGRRVSSSFVSYLNDPLTILLFWGASYSGYTPGLTDELKRNLRASSWLTYISVELFANWFILVQISPCSIALWAGELEKAD